MLSGIYWTKHSFKYPFCVGNNTGVCSMKRYWVFLHFFNNVFFSRNLPGVRGTWVLRREKLVSCFFLFSLLFIPITKENDCCKCSSLYKMNNKYSKYIKNIVCLFVGLFVCFCDNCKCLFLFSFCYLFICTIILSVLITASGLQG